MNISCPSCGKTEKRLNFDATTIITCSRCGWDIINNNRKLKSLTQGDVNEMCKLHALHLCGDIGGYPADFSYCDLSGLDFSGKDLRRADFRGSNLTGANFSDAILRSADLRGTNLAYSNFTNSSRNDIKLGPIE